jgi:hypothetical protein
MIRYVLLDSNLGRQLKRLHQAGGMAKVAAEHAEEIIRQWVSGDVKRPKQLTRGTRYGEARIKNCLKYDLVEAYRLLAVLDGDRIIFLFFGSHDDCDQWIFHNTGWEPGLVKRRNEILPVQHPILEAATEEPESQEDDGTDDYVHREIDERDLRIIFSGICRSRAAQPQGLTGTSSEG